MKNPFGLFLVLIISSAGWSQNAMQVRHLATLGQVWGFLKYYHPAAASGNPDWDNELLRLVPQAKACPSDQAFDSLMLAWYKSLPAAALSDAAINWHADSLTRVFTEKDIRNFSIPDSLKMEFLKLYTHHLPVKSRYITRHYKEYYLDHIVHTEDAHETPAYPAEPMRLLALFRYWNTLSYFYPHKARMPEWDQVLDRYIPRFSSAKDSGEYRMAVRELIHELPDAHSFMQEPGSVYYFTPFRIDYVEGRYVVGQVDDSASARWGYQAGDEIVSINGIPVARRLRALEKTVTGTNSASLHRNLGNELLKTGDSVLQVGFRRKDSILEKPVMLHTWNVYRKIARSPAPPLWQELEKGIWYVRFCQIRQEDTLAALFRDIHNARAVIWDMRDYPNYQVTTRLYQYLFPQKTLFTIEKNPSDLFPGAFRDTVYGFTPPEKENLIYPGPMIVLVDEHTQSLAESVAAVLLLRPNTVTMGRPTAGTTGNITWFSLPGGIEVSYTGVGVTGMNQSFLEGRGVKLDIPLKLSRERIIRSGDYILDRALAHARNKY